MIALHVCLLAYSLPPPQVLKTAFQTTELLVAVSETLELLLVEADAAAQGSLVDEALDSDAPAGGPIDDVYGVVLWPAAQVVASAVASLDLSGKSVLELGAGTGLVSITAAACGASSVATDYRDEPLELLRASAARSSSHLGRPLDVSTARFDITSEQPLPAPGFHVLVAADLLYMRSTSEALARRCAEALRLPATEAVLVGDLGRPGRAAFLETLRACGVRDEAARFEPVDGWTAGAPRHELVSSSDGSPKGVSVGLMRLTPSDLRDDG